MSETLFPPLHDADGNRIDATVHDLVAAHILGRLLEHPGLPEESAQQIAGEVLRQITANPGLETLSMWRSRLESGAYYDAIATVAPEFGAAELFQFPVGHLHRRMLAGLAIRAAGSP